ncbi:hypothetical protein IscW_ISCW022835, partial [Ixodes scapularis]
VFPSGELHVRKVDPGTDSHRKYYCQAKHRLTGKVYRSSTVARLIIIGDGLLSGLAAWFPISQSR